MEESGTGPLQTQKKKYFYLDIVLDMQVNAKCKNNLEMLSVVT